MHLLVRLFSEPLDLTSRRWPVHFSFVLDNWLGVRLLYMPFAECFLIQNVSVFCWLMHQML